MKNCIKYYSLSFVLDDVVVDVFFIVQEMEDVFDDEVFDLFMVGVVQVVELIIVEIFEVMYGECLDKVFVKLLFDYLCSCFQ